MPSSTSNQNVTFFLVKPKQQDLTDCSTDFRPYLEDLNRIHDLISNSMFLAHKNTGFI